jgi:putative nucleotidyltransferase with HDIG domain
LPASLSQLESKRRRPLLLVVVSLVLTTFAHFTVARATHGQHVVHIILGSLYLIPIIASALWFNLRGCIAVTAVISAVYYAHIRLSWPNQPMENANQFAMIAVYWVLAFVSGMLVNLRERERARHLAAERSAEREAVIEGLAGLSNALRARDEYTREHSEHVSRLAAEIGRRRGLSAERLELVRLAGLAHDIGKIGVRDDVLLKPHELTPEERIAIERHPVVAAEILRPIHGAREIAEIVLAHHECPDGSGYPYGRKADKIPLEAHIIRVADVFCSLAERRHYKAALEAGETLRMMRAMAGTKLDAESVRILEAVITKQDQPSDVP